MEGGMVEAGAMFATLMGLIKVIEKLVDSKMSPKSKPVEISLDQTELTSELRSISETQIAIAQTLERVNDGLDAIDQRTKETGSTIYEVRELIRADGIRQEERARVLAELKRGESTC